MNKSEYNREANQLQSYQERFKKYHGHYDNDVHPVEVYMKHRLTWLKQFGGVCLVCENAPATSLDHIHPIHKGGLHRVWNIAYICNDCNASKGTRSVQDWLYHKPAALKAYMTVMQLQPAQPKPKVEKVIGSGKAEPKVKVETKVVPVVEPVVPVVEPKPAAGYKVVKFVAKVLVYLWTTYTAAAYMLPAEVTQGDVMTTVLAFTIFASLVSVWIGGATALVVNNK